MVARLVLLWCAARGAGAETAAAPSSPFGGPGFEACAGLAARATRSTATPRLVEDGHACVDALERSRPAGGPLGAEYYDVVPLVETRALQALAYGGLDGAGRARVGCLFETSVPRPTTGTWGPPPPGRAEVLSFARIEVPGDVRA